MGRRPPAYRKDCEHCGKPIVMIRTVWGAERPFRDYELQETATADAHPHARWAYSQRYGGVVQLEPELPADSPHLPARVLVRHACPGALEARRAAREAAEAEEAYGALFRAWSAGEAPETKRQPVQRSNLGFRRGFGKRSGDPG